MSTNIDINNMVKPDYKQKIIELLEKIENTEYLFKIYHYVLAKYRRENEKKEEAGD